MKWRKISKGLYGYWDWRIMHDREGWYALLLNRDASGWVCFVPAFDTLTEAKQAIADNKINTGAPITEWRLRTP